MTGSIPKITNGQVTNSVNGIYYKEHNQLRHEETKHEHLRKVRAFPFATSAPHIHMPAQYKKLASTANILGLRQQMQELKMQIDANLARLSALDAAPAERSALKKIARGTKKGVSTVVGIGLLSIPGKKADLKRAMRRPHRLDMPKGNENSGTPAELLGEGKIRQRKGTYFLEHAAYLHERAKQHLEYGPQARKDQLNARLELIQPHYVTLSDAMACVQNAIKGVAIAEQSIARLRQEQKEHIAGLQNRFAQLEAQEQALRMRIDASEKKTKDMRQSVQAPLEKIAEAEFALMSRLSVHLASKGGDGPLDIHDKSLQDEIRAEKSAVDSLQKKVVRRQTLVKTSTQEIDLRRLELHRIVEEKAGIGRQIEQAQDESADEKLTEAKNSLLQSENSYKTAIGNLENVLENIAAGGSDGGDHQQALAREIEGLFVDAENSTKHLEGAGRTVAVAQYMETRLKGLLQGIEVQLDKSNVNDDLKRANENLKLAEQLVERTRQYVENAKKIGKPESIAVAGKIAALDGFTNAATAEADKATALEGHCADLQGRFEVLFDSLCMQPEPKGDQLDNKTVFDLAYQAIADVSAAHAGEDGDPKRAADMLAELAKPEMNMRRLMSDEISEDARLLAQTIAVLPRGMEILRRLLPDESYEMVPAAVAGTSVTPNVKGKEKELEIEAGASPEQKEQAQKKQKLDAIQKTVALQTYLRAGKERSDLGDAMNISTRQLLDAAQAAAKKVYDDPEVKLADAEQAAFSAARNRLTDTGHGSHTQYVSDRLNKFIEAWIPRGLERSNSTFGRIRQGSNTGIGRIMNVLPTTGKTPVGSKTLAAADRTATAYMARELETTAIRMDGYLLQSAEGLRKSAIALLKQAIIPQNMKQLLVSIAAADVARDKLAAAAENGQPLRPEHCIVGGKISREDTVKAVTTAVKDAFAAAKLQDRGDLVPVVAAAIANAVGTAMVKGSPDTGQLIAAAMAAAGEAMWQIDDSPDAKKEFLKKLNIAGPIDAICAADAPDDINAVRTKLMELGREAGLNEKQQAHIYELSEEIRYPLPAIASEPFKAENLIQSTKALRECVNPKDLNPQSKDLIDQAAAATERVQHLIDTSPPPELKTIEDVYNYLLPRLEQIENPGRMRLVSGGVVGISTKGLSDTISKTKWLGGIAGLSPRLRLEGLGGGNAVLEIGMSSVGMEIWITTEKRKSAAAGVGIGGSLGITEARGSFNVDKAVMGEKITHEGIKFLIPRSRTGAYSDNDVRLEAKKLLDAIFHWQPPVNETGELSGIPGHLGAILAACPHVSVAVVGKMSENLLKQESVGNAVFSSKGTIAGGKQSLGANFALGGKNTHLNWREYNISEQTGLHNIERHNLAYGGHVFANTGVGPAATVASTAGDLQNAFGVSTSGVSTSRQTKTAGADVKLRLVTIDGKTDPAYTRREFEHTGPATLRKNVEANFERWVQLGVELLFRKPGDQEIPIEERRRIARQSLEAALTKCETSELSSQGNPHLRNVYAETYSLRDSAAGQLDGLRCEEALVDARIGKLEQHIQALKAGPGGGAAAAKEARKKLTEARQEKIKLIDAQHALYQDDGSWTPWKVSANERTWESGQQGLDLLFKVGGTDYAEGQRPVFAWPY